MTMVNKQKGSIKKKNRGRVRNILIMLLLLTCCSGALLAYEFYIRSPLCGIWERTLDESAGTQIDVYRRDDRYYAVIISAEGEMMERGFDSGDLVWRDIEKIDENKYQGREMIGSFFGFNYENFFLTMKDHKTLDAEPASGGIFLSSSQTWKKQNSNVFTNLKRLFGIEGSFPPEKVKEAPDPEPNIVFANDKSWSGWSGLDYSINDEGGVTIFRNRHMAPNIHYNFRSGELEDLQSDAIFTANMQLTGFINTTYTLLTVFTDDTNIALVTDKTGRIGIVTGPDGTPEYSDPGVFSNEVHDVSLFFNLRESQIVALIDNEPVLIIQRFFPFRTIQSAWMGVVWIGGANNFGPPVRHIINHFEIGYFE